jgi:hypothetical protein
MWRLVDLPTALSYPQCSLKCSNVTTGRTPPRLRPLDASPAPAASNELYAFRSSHFLGSEIFHSKLTGHFRQVKESEILPRA